MKGHDTCKPTPREGCFHISFHNDFRLVVLLHCSGSSHTGPVKPVSCGWNGVNHCSSAIVRVTRRARLKPLKAQPVRAFKSFITARLMLSCGIKWPHEDSGWFGSVRRGLHVTRNGVVLGREEGIHE
jgi:hypothetical protein